MERKFSNVVWASTRVVQLSLAAFVVLAVSPQTRDETPPLLSAVLSGDARSVEQLLQRGADPNQTGPLGTTALMWAVPDLEKVRILLAHAANVNARAETDRTALLVASTY